MYYFGPKKYFITYKLFCSISQSIGQGNSFCIDELLLEYSRTMAGQFLHIYGHQFLLDLY